MRRRAANDAPDSAHSADSSDDTDFEVYYRFPSPESATAEGIVAIGGDLSPGMLLSAYRQGIFPWYSHRQPVLWWSPDPRFVLYPERFHISKSLRRTLNRSPFEIRFDTAFAEVIARCKGKRRPRQRGTWITDQMRDGYIRLHELGFAHSVEAWREGVLVGGLYGISIGRGFFGESMFADVDDASKVCLVRLVEFARRRSFAFIDSQVYTDNLARFGADDVPRDEYLVRLAEVRDEPTLRGSWRGLEGEEASSATATYRFPSARVRRPVHLV